MRSQTLVATAAAILGLTLSSPLLAATSSAVFAFTTSGGSASLTINGSTIDAFQTGWYDQNGNHAAINPNYIVGLCGSSDSCNGDNVVRNDFFAFDLSGVQGFVTSATLNIFEPSNGYYGPLSGLTYTNYDVSTPVGELTADQFGRTDIFNDLGSGFAYGSTVITPAQNGSVVSIALDSAAFADIQASEGGSFAIGGSLGVSAVPLPASAPLFGAALLVLASARYRLKRRMDVGAA